MKLLPNMINRRDLAHVRLHCLKTFDSACFQYVLSNGGDDGKNDTGQSPYQLPRVYVGVI